MESVIKILPTKQSQESDGFPGESGLTDKEELIPVLLKLFQNT